mmetsp:Transcript_19562/g.50524  ORF Transcript_19562/g.50524 Transcript_19562/m.50524 type:complete len:290 (+) Transcript_19562:204-1073(+)
MPFNKELAPAVTLLFVAGLEGTGHHLWKEHLNKCRSSGFCSALPHRYAMDIFAEQETLHKTPRVFTEARLHRGAELLNQSALAVNGSGIVVLNTLTDGMHSYPTGGPFPRRAQHGDGKFLTFPDVYELSRMADVASLDLRVLVLMRPASEILHSTIVKRNYSHNPLEQHAVLVAAATALAQQVTRVPARHVRCVWSMSLASEEEAELDDLLHFIHPNMPEQVRKMLRRSFRQAPIAHRRRSARSQEHHNKSLLSQPSTTMMDMMTYTLSDTMNKTLVDLVCKARWTTSQ